MKLIGLTCCFLFTSFITLAVEKPSQLFQQGNQAYQQQAYEEALTCYDSLYQAGYISPELYFNLGNAYYQLNQMPSAILFYEKAQKISGYRPDVAYNLALAREQIPDNLEKPAAGLFQKWWQTAVRYFSLATWGLLTIVLIWLSLLGIGGFLWLRIPWLQKFMLITGIFALFLFLSSLTLMLGRYNERTATHHGIIFTPSVYVKSAPDAASKDLFILHGGTKVALDNELGQWKKVRLPDGKQGWVRENKLRII